MLRRHHLRPPIEVIFVEDVVERRAKVLDGCTMVESHRLSLNIRRTGQGQTLRVLACRRAVATGRRVVAEHEGGVIRPRWQP